MFLSDNVDFKKIWKIWLIKSDLKELRIATELKTTQQGINKRAKTGTMQVREFLSILDHYGYEIKIVKKSK